MITFMFALWLIFHIKPQKIHAEVTAFPLSRVGRNSFLQPSVSIKHSAEQSMHRYVLQPSSLLLPFILTGSLLGRPPLSAGLFVEMPTRRQEVALPERVVKPLSHYLQLRQLLISPLDPPLPPLTVHLIDCILLMVN